MAIKLEGTTMHKSAKIPEFYFSGYSSSWREYRILCVTVSIFLQAVHTRWYEWELKPLDLWIISCEIPESFWEIIP